MVVLRTLLAGVVAATVAGCLQTFTEYQELPGQVRGEIPTEFLLLEPGMSRDQVVALLGEPDTDWYDSDRWRIDDSALDEIEVTYRDGRAAAATWQDVGKGVRFELFETPSA